MHFKWFVFASFQGSEQDLKAKESTLNQVIQEGRSMMDNLEKGMTIMNIFVHVQDFIGKKKSLFKLRSF